MTIGSSGRRTFLGGAAGAAITMGLPLRLPAATSLIKRPFGRTGETLPVIGMGSWITFNVGSSARLRDARAQVLATFFDAGGTMIDSSPCTGRPRPSSVTDYARPAPHPGRSVPPRYGLR